MWQAYRGYIVGAVVVLALQTWLIVGLLVSRAHRRRARRALDEQLRLKTLVSDVLATLITQPADSLDAQVTRALARIAADLDVDRIVLEERHRDTHAPDVTHAWASAGIPPVPASVDWSELPWMARRVGHGHVVVASLHQPLPAEAETDRRSMLARGIHSMLAVPLVLEGAVVGVLSCATGRPGLAWPSEVTEPLRVLAEIFANTLARRRAEASALETEERFHRQREELAHALRVHTLGELGSSLAHELTQPLTAILMNTRVLERRSADATTTAETLADIAADARRAGAIIDRLRALARKEHAFQAGLNLDALIDEVAGLLHQDFVRKGIVVRRIALPDLPRVSGDPIQLQQIFLNLLVNASDAVASAARGSREITIVTGHPAPGLVEASIRDTGPGGDQVDLEQIFQRFVTTKAGGLGMGLAISRSIAEAHGGRIYAKANTDHGLTLHVELPAEPTPVATAELGLG